ncbi:MAG TPA: sulfatase-like hydrolase/transferase, partial [archaeon]|nr:sulfatase-like hydrolase/transferase [archaeon]
LEHNGRRVKTTGYINKVLTGAALGFIEKNSSRPFFCYLPYNTPHSPLQVPDRYFDKYKARGVDDELASIYGMCENLDDNLGRLLGKLDELNLADDTIVLFLTDNGANSERFNGGMKGFKGSVHEGGTRVPCFMRWPGHIQPGTVIGQISAHIDLLPTIVELLGIEKPDTLPLDGVSLAPLLRGQTSGWADRMIFTNFRNNGAVRTQRYRLVLKEGSDPELYDMEVDPGEEKNIAREYPEVAGGLRSAYEVWYKDVTRLGNDRLPIPVGYEEMKAVELPAPECYFEGDLKYKGLAGYANDWVTGWTSTESRLYWDIDVVRSGTYEITLFYTCPKEDIGAKLRVEVAGEHLEGIIEKAHDPEPIPSPDRVPRNEVYEKVWAPLTLGTMKLQKGRTRLYVKALTKPGNSVMDLKSVRIRWVD